ncbi:MAG: AAA family ATPase [Methylococcales bacterium]|nr:AAA family ATPase [Methylococcales bacterium]
MQSINFEHLRAKWFDLAELGADAENYIFSDPQSAVIKLRCFAELIVGHIYRDLCLPSNENANFFERLDDENFKSAVNRPILDKLHAIRINGNKAAHKGSISSEDTLWLVKEAYLIGCWLYITQGMGAANDYQEFVAPVNKQNEKIDLNEKNLELEQALQELELIRLREKEAQKELDKLKLEIDKNKFEAFIYCCLVAKNNINFEEDETRRRINMKDIYSEYQLTDGQEQLIDRLEYFFSDKTQQVFLLKGYAGTGKTFITKGLTEYFNSVGRNYILAAPTGKAAKVIAQKTKSQACTLHKTIYSFEDIVEYKDTDTDGKETYKFYYELGVNDNSVDTVYIIDEASMIADIYQEAEFMRFGSGFLLKDFLKYANLDCNDHNKKIIFIGDAAQLPPIDMNYSPALDTKYLLKEYNLN